MHIYHLTPFCIDRFRRGDLWTPTRAMSYSGLIFLGGTALGFITPRWELALIVWAFTCFTTVMTFFQMMKQVAEDHEAYRAWCQDAFIHAEGDWNYPVKSIFTER